MNKLPSTVSFRSLTEEFELTKKELGETEETLRRITGRDPDAYSNGLQKWRFQQGQQQGKPLPGTAKKRPLFPIVKTHEEDTDESPDEDDVPSKKPSLQSTVVATSKDSKTRKDLIQEQNINSKIKARNRRMFGIMLGTLQKFQNEETKRKEQDLKKAEVEQKVEAAVVEEKERVKKEKEELLHTRREKQVQLRCLQRKMEIAELQEAWEASHKQMINYIRTKTTPHIYFLPARHNKKSMKMLEESQTKVIEMIKEHRKETEKNLKEVEEFYKRSIFPFDKENIGPFEEESQEALSENQDMETDATAPDAEANAISGLDSTLRDENVSQSENADISNNSDETVSISNTLPKGSGESASHKPHSVENEFREDRTKDDANGDEVKMADQEFEPIYD